MKTFPNCLWKNYRFSAKKEGAKRIWLENIVPIYSVAVHYCFEKFDRPVTPEVKKKVYRRVFQLELSRFYQQLFIVKVGTFFNKAPTQNW